MKPVKIIFYAMLVALVPFGPLALWARDFVLPQSHVDVAQPQMSYKTVPTNDAEELFMRLHNEVSKNGSFLPKSYDQARFYLYSKVDVEQEGEASGVRDMYSGVLMEGTSGSDGCHVECKDANGDGIINYQDLTDEDREICETGEVVGNKPPAKCKAGVQDLGGDGAAGDFINIEHLWPKQAFGQQEALIGDLHNLRPSFSKPNAQRGSSPYAPNGAKMWDKMHGDVARALFYFALTYYDRVPKGAADAYFTASVPTLMKWNREDPPDEYEKKRTELAAQFQGNTNPFVADPGLVDRIGQSVWQSLFRH
ncbi:MAG: hypothetical protein GX410_08505 [Elusimicrobia bacterium]|nr:hypothetical protein [Elusimicrobiota bacterium]